MKKECSHGKLWNESCINCEEIRLIETITWLRPRIHEMEARLKEINLNKQKVDSHA